MQGYKFLMDLALILLSTKLLGLLTRKVQMPQVVGALLAGLILGPAMLNVISDTQYIKDSAEIGVVVLMFTAGLETDVHELKRSGKASFVIALIGVIVPLIGGYFVAQYFNRPGLINSSLSAPRYLQNIFIGVILTATSVSITVETLKEIGKLNTRSGNAILGAAIIDDVLGIIALTIVTSMADTSVSLVTVLLKIALFFVFAGVVGYGFLKFYRWWTAKSEKGLRRHTIVAFVFCLLISYCAEKFFGVADITGAYIAGLVISMTPKREYVANRFSTLSYLYLSPIFFASIGLEVKLPAMNSTIVMFSVILVIVAIITKIIGCGVGALVCHYRKYQSLRIGVGMISRGEVALVVASKGQALGLISKEIIGPVILVVIITTIVTPIMLKSVFARTMKYTPQGVAAYKRRLAAAQGGAPVDEDQAYEKNAFAKTYEDIDSMQESGNGPKGSNHSDQK